MVCAKRSEDLSLLKVSGSDMPWVIGAVVFLLAVSGVESVEFFTDSLSVLYCPTWLAALWVA